jgi:hypothetical protein
MPRALLLLVVLVTVGLGAGEADGAATDVDLNVIPRPKSLERFTGAMTIGAQGRLLFAEASLQVLARVVSNDGDMNTTAPSP